MLPDPRLYFADLCDPRRETRNKLHQLSDIIMIVFCAVLSGIEDWVGGRNLPNKRKGGFEAFWSCPTAFPHPTRSATCSDG
jgi:hypothetical protein